MALRPAVSMSVLNMSGDYRKGRGRLSSGFFRVSFRYRPMRVDLKTDPGSFAVIEFHPVVNDVDYMR
jgi:hypothetical protein